MMTARLIHGFRWRTLAARAAAIAAGGREAGRRLSELQAVGEQHRKLEIGRQGNRHRH
jgi:hypothetical protein